LFIYEKFNSEASCSSLSKAHFSISSQANAAVVIIIRMRLAALRALPQVGSVSEHSVHGINWISDPDGHSYGTYAYNYPWTTNPRQPM